MKNNYLYYILFCKDFKCKSKFVKLNVWNQSITYINCNDFCDLEATAKNVISNEKKIF